MQNSLQDDGSKLVICCAALHEVIPTRQTSRNLGLLARQSKVQSRPEVPRPDLETADISEGERRRAYLASAEYQQRRQKLVEWEQRQRAQEAYEHYRQGERESYSTQTATQPNSAWQQAQTTKERVQAGSDVLYNLATAIGVVEIARHAHFLKDTPPSSKTGSSLSALWGSMRYQAEKWNYDWQKVQAKIDDVRGRTAVAIQQTIESGKDWRAKMNAEWSAHWTSFSGQAKMTWDAFRRNGLRGLKVDAGDVVDFSGSVADIGSAIGYAGYAVTGNERWRTAGQWADVASVPAAVRQVATNLKPAIQFFTKGSAAKGVSFLGKVAGPLAIVTGGFSTYSGYQTFQEGKQDGNTSKKVQGIAGMIAGATAIAGGVTLLIPGAQPVAGVLLGVSVVASAVSVVAENWTSSQSFFTRPSTSYPGGQPTPAVPLPPPTPPTAVSTPTGSTPTPPLTSTPTTTPTPSATNTAPPTPQTTQTPQP